MKALFFFLLACATSVQAQTTMRIQVNDATTRTPLPRATITITRPNGTPMYLETDSTGTAQYDKFSAGGHMISAQAIGYEASQPRRVDIEEGTFTEFLISLSPAPIGLDPVEATVKAEPGRSPDLIQNGFYNRMKFNNGIYIDQTEIQERNQRYLSELIRNRPGISVRPGPGGENYVWFRGSENFGMGGAGVGLCGPAVYIDGALAHPSGPQATPIDRLLATSDLAGIEIYRRPSQIPQQFSGLNSGCGIILLWTRLRS